MFILLAAIAATGVTFFVTWKAGELAYNIAERHIGEEYAGPAMMLVWLCVVLLFAFSGDHIDLPARFLQDYFSSDFD